MDSVHLLTDVRDMAGLMASADLAVSAAGSTCWELAFMGVPMVVVSLAANQTPMADGLAAAGLALNLGWHEGLSIQRINDALRRLIGDAQLRREMSNRGRECVDGRGADRVTRMLRRVSVTLRPAESEDCRRLWQWANDPEVRSLSFSHDPIPWERHVEWFQSRLRDPACLLFIGCDDTGTPVGQVRLDLGSDEATISVSVRPESRGRGLGVMLIERAGDELRRRSRIDKINAFIKTDNASSVRAFEKAGYVVFGAVTIQGQDAVHLVWRK
jgi:RimJ/RimL family protein N-acetyltransferase